MQEPSQKPSRQNYYIEVVTDPPSQNCAYYLTYGLKGRVLMIFDRYSFSILSEKGWHKENHRGFERIELSSDQKSVLVYYQNQRNPRVLAVPPPMTNGKASAFTLFHIDKVLEQMKEKGLSYDDFWAEYYHGTNTVYSYDAVKKQFKVTLTDVIAASFCEEEVLTVPEIREKLLTCASMQDLRKQGFEI